MTFQYHANTKTPFQLGDRLQLTPNDRAAVMGGRAHKDGDDLKEAIVVRFVVTGYARTGAPIVVCERVAGKDALGTETWVEYTPPVQVLASALVRVMWPFVQGTDLDKPCDACGAVHAGMC